MNTIYRIVWNTALGKWVVASELAHGRGKRTARRTVLSCVLSALLVTSAAAADAPSEVVCQDADNKVVTCDVDASTNMGALFADTDPITGAQLRSSVQSIADAFGGGAGIDANGLLTAPSYVLGGTTYGDVGSALGGLDERVTNNEQAIANIPNGSRFIATFNNSGTAAATNIGPNSLAVGQGAYASGSSANAFGSSSRAINNGALAVGASANASGNNSTAIGLSSASSGGNTVAIGTGARGTSNSSTAIGASANVAGAGSTAIGYYSAIGASSTNAVAVGAGSTVTANVSNALAIGAGSRVSAADSSALGYLAQATGENSVALGAGSVATRDNVVSVGAGYQFGNGSRQVINVANGTESADAVNVQQLRPIVAALGGGAAMSAMQGIVTGPRYVLQGNDYNNVGDALDAVDGSLTSLDGRVANNEGDITEINNVLNNFSGGTAGLVRQASPSDMVTVAAGSAGGSVDFSGLSGARQLKGVANGTDDADAVNVSQLSAAIDGVRSGDTRYFKAGGENDGSDDASVAGEGAVAAGANARAAGNGSVALGQGARAAADNAVALGANSVADRANSVAVGSAGAERQITHVADASEDTDAVNLRQLKAAGLIGDGGQSLDAVVYDVDSQRGRITFGGAEGTVLGNVADGRIGQGSREAVNGGQIAALRDELNGQIGHLDERVGQVENGAGSGGKGTPYYDANAAGDAADGASSLVGAGTPATAAGAGSVAAGSGADASAANAVALGAGSVADRDNTVAVGHEGGERQITHVARGVRETDAVNVSQLNQGLSDAKAYADSRVQDVWDGLNDRVDHASRQANRGIAGAAALIQVTPYLPGKTVLNAGMASYRGETALGVGISRWSDNGRVNINAGISAARGDRPILRFGVGIVLGD